MLAVEKTYFGNVDLTDSFLTVSVSLIQDLISGLLASAMKKLTYVIRMLEKYWDSST